MNPTTTIYFADRSVRISGQEPEGEAQVIRLAAGERVGRAKILKIFENQNDLVLLTPEPGEVFAYLAAEFTAVEAAGGVVVDDRGAWLMIHRNGRWDLPKGHVEPGEAVEVCAVREVAEETGVVGARVVRPLCETLHAYNLYGRWEMKRTHWFEMEVAAASVTVPQHEEGIDCACWCMPDAVERNLAESYPTIRCVAGAMRR